MVAQNHELYDKNTLIGHGKFSLNGGLKCGYTLKPPFLTDEEPKLPSTTTQLTFRLISGQNVSALLPPNTSGKEYYCYVDCEFYGFEPEMNLNLPWRSPICSFNMFHPQWKVETNEPFTYETRFPNFSVFVLRVIEARDGTILGRACIPISACRPGYRVIQLLDPKHNKLMGAYLLLNIGKRKLRVTDEDPTKYVLMDNKMNENSTENMNMSLKHMESLASQEFLESITVEVKQPEEGAEDKVKLNEDDMDADEDD